jgi:hypothetical protein
MVRIRLHRLSLVLLTAAFLAACSAGTDFKRPDAATFQLGRTTEKEIRERFGEPRSQATIQANDRTIKVLRYAYAEAAPYVEKVPARAMVYSFHEGTLVGFDYSSSFSSDKTDFDESVLGRIRRGETTQDQVMSLLGPPTGQFVYPSTVVSTPDQHAYHYSYSRTDKPPLGGALKTVIKELAIIFDSRDVVTDTKLAISGNK